MSAFYFTSGLGQPMCKAAPADGIIVRSPKGTRVQFSANGVNIDIGSTVVLKAERNKQLTVRLLEGSAKVTANYRLAYLTPGQSLTVPLGGADGLQAVGEPSVPTTSATTGEEALLNLAPASVSILAPIDPSIVPPTATPPAVASPTPIPPANGKKDIEKEKAKKSSGEGVDNTGKKPKKDENPAPPKDSSGPTDKGKPKPKDKDKDNDNSGGSTPSGGGAQPPKKPEEDDAPKKDAKKNTPAGPDKKSAG
jgi:hypothetical protein